MTGKIISMLTAESTIMQEEFYLLAMGLNGIPVLLITISFLFYKVRNFKICVSNLSSLEYGQY